MPYQTWDQTSSSLLKNQEIEALRCLWVDGSGDVYDAMRPYPAWVAAIAVNHPELTLGFDVSTVVTAAGIVEFGLAFALLWTHDLKAYRLAPSEKRNAPANARTLARLGKIF